MTTKERTLANLRNSLSGKIHVYLKDPETVKQFYADAEAQGWRFGALLPSESPLDDVIALEHGNRLSHVGAVGRIAFQCGGGSNAGKNYHRIDYARYLRGDAHCFFGEET